MHLLERDAAGGVTLRTNLVGTIPPYAILSHTWGEGEVLFKDIVDGTAKTKPGYKKIRFCADQAWRDGLRFCWVDTCCIDKTNAVELQEAINSMFRWYRGAAKCYVFLADVPVANWQASFCHSRWFTRGWTLQELIAPGSVEFFSREEKSMGNREALEQDITGITGIPLNALRGGSLSDLSVRERFAWMERRETTREEDKAYALLGIFDVQMPMIYGEGVMSAFRRLREVISPSKRAAEDKAKDDECIADLRNTDPRDDKTRIEQTKGGLLAGSCQWVLDHADFQRWHRDEQTRLLWIKGDAGKGKTMLLCGIVDELSKSVPDAAVSFFFLQATDTRTNYALAVVRGLIYLLVEQQSSLVRHLRKPYDHAGQQLFQDANAWTATCTILRNMLQDPTVHAAYLVVDALDECQGNDLFKLLDLIVSLSTLSRVKWLVSSRNWPQIEQRLRVDPARTRLSLEIQQNAEQVACIVSAYIDASVSSLPCLVDDADLQQHVRSVMRQRADSTFLWVSLVVEELRKANSWEIGKIIDELPSGLTELYRRMVRQIWLLKPETSKFCRLIILIMIASYRPLSLQDLAALSGLPQHIASRTDRVEKLVKTCGSLFTVRNGVVYMVHQSARDFLVGEALQSMFSIDIRQVHRGLSRRSIRILSNVLRRDIYCLQHPGSRYDEVRRPSPDPLAMTAYACVYWIDHLRDSDPGKYATSDLQDDGPVARFLTSKYLNWLEAVSLLGSLSEGIGAISKLHTLLTFDMQLGDTQLGRFVHDARRFVLAHRSVIEQAPLQTYTAALVFSPTNSLVRQRFRAEEPQWILCGPHMENEWGTCLLTLEGHNSSVWSVAWSHDAALLASASGDKTVKVWDAKTGHCVLTLEGHNAGVSSVAWSHDAALLASAAGDNTIKIWEAKTGRCLSTLEAHHDWVFSVAWSYDAALLASASADNTVIIWDAKIGKCIRTLEGHTKVITSVAWSHDTAWLASGSDDKTVKIWNRTTGECVGTLKGHTSGITSLAWSHDGVQLASTSEYDDQVKIWEMTGRCTSTLHGNCYTVICVAWSTHTVRLATGSEDHTVNIWDAATGQCTSTLQGHGSTVNAVAWSHDSTRLASASDDNSVKIWDTATGQTIPTVEKHGSWVTSLAWSHNGARLASASDTADEVSVKVWDGATGDCISTLEGHCDPVSLVTWSHDTARLASASYDTIKIWNADTGRWRCISTIQGQSEFSSPLWDAGTAESCDGATFEGHSREVSCMAWSPDATCLASGSSDYTIKIWNGDCVLTLKGHTSDVTSVAWSHDAALVASASRDKTVKIWNPTRGTCVSTFGHCSPIKLVAWSPSAQWLASGPCCHKVKIWDLANGKCNWLLQGPIGYSAESVAWSHDAMRLVSAFGDKTVRIYDMATGWCISLDTSESIGYPRFDGSDSNVLCTEIGAFDLGPLMRSPVSGHVSHHRLTSSLAVGYGLNTKRTWITYRGQNLLWLPPGYRPFSSAISGRAISIGSSSGRVLILRFSDGDPVS